MITLTLLLTLRPSRCLPSRASPFPTLTALLKAFVRRHFVALYGTIPAPSTVLVIKELCIRSYMYNYSIYRIKESSNNYKLTITTAYRTLFDKCTHYNYITLTDQLQ